MPFRTVPSSKNPPKERSLVVCAGTVTCKEVDQMGSGFVVFKSLFNSHLHVSDDNTTWEDELNKHLMQFNAKSPVALPAYIRLAKQSNDENSYIGGVATVPSKAGNKGLTWEKFSNNTERDKSFIEQYKEAIEKAIDDAKALHRPLYIQPLGIGVYGWKPEEAAKLFAEVILKSDPNDELDITIPIFGADSSSNDKKFERTLIQEMAKHSRSPTETTQNKETLDALPSKPVRNDGEKAEDRVMNSQRIKLTTIITTLINNIETKQGTRWTSGHNSKKINDLKELKRTMHQTLEDEWSEKEGKFILNILKICEQRRNILHFWATPESVTEFKALLKEQNIELPQESGVHLNHKAS
ncbi:hypothetical protein [Legionella hackeliae]|uniref:Macro domain-containing protein n=1 Tax=Legionella hackeliae TaxID=449 RepID=A0A0A8URP7_LEGHA|nr:hypothetical protein [Legionella hackeliae]KTD12411.1 hypothetical protein Lhac_1282 [Legionella hackeliae]CEK10161.1 protein of unknown function [Legionella hackeliae]STX46884.1 Uncharacterised protein [Legionella hackeliae]